MGIRIHRAVGYGLLKKDFKTALIKDWRHHFEEVLSERTTPSLTQVMRDYDAAHPDEHIMMFIHMPTKQGKLMASDKEYPRDLTDMIHVCQDCDEKPHALLFQPPAWAESWTRWDHAIDYYDAMRRDDLLGSAYYLDRSLYPEDGYMTPEGDFVRGDLAMHGEYQRRQGNVPLVPSAVRAIAEASGLLLEQRSWKHFRPILATWWG